MDIDFFKEKSGGGETSGNGVKAFFKKLKPIHFAIVGGIAALGILIYNAASGTSTSTDTTYTADDTTDSTTATAAEVSADDLNTVIDSLNSSLETMNDYYTGRFESLEENVSNVAENQATETDLTDAINKSVSSALNSIEEEKETDAFNSQVAAAKEIKSLQDVFSAAKASALANDNKIDATEYASLLDIHSQAEKIGTAAGFGSGSLDGSARVIPDEVKKAAGLS